MIKLYIKQAWAMLKQNVLFSTLYVAGTGLAIAMTMIIAIIYYVKIAPIYPEVNRSKTLYLSAVRMQEDGGHSNYQSQASYKALKEWFYPVKNAVAVSGSSNDWNGADYIQTADGNGDLPVQVKYTDPAFFRIYKFTFLEGKPFTEVDLKSGLHSAVITDEMAKRIFSTDHGVVGRTFAMNYLDFRVTGVVRSASFLTSKSYAQIYLPYSVRDGYDKAWNKDYLGDYSVTFLVASEAQEKALHAEIADLVRKINIQHAKEWKLELWDQPTSHLLSVFQPYPSDKGFSVWSTVRHYLVIILVLLLVPALNLSGMISSRMETRLAEMGVRKSFGASRKKLLSQVMWENLLLTLLGGLLGLVLAWSTLYVSREWVFSLFDSWPEQLPDGVFANVSGEMLFAPIVFVIALLLCVLLNLLSALLPAWRSLRSPIMKSLNEKR